MANSELAHVTGSVTSSSGEYCESMLVPHVGAVTASVVAPSELSSVWCGVRVRVCVLVGCLSVGMICVGCVCELCYCVCDVCAGGELCVIVVVAVC